MTNPDRILAADLAVPILVAPIPGDHGHLVIDGWHRVKRALAEHVTHLPARVLTLADEQACRLRGRLPAVAHWPPERWTRGRVAAASGGG